VGAWTWGNRWEVKGIFRDVRVILKMLLVSRSFLAPRGSEGCRLNFLEYVAGHRKGGTRESSSSDI
jgi:hypothetical protein